MDVPPALPEFAVTDGASAGSALVAEARTAMETLGRLRKHEARLGSEVLVPVDTAVQDIQRRLKRQHINVCVIGEQKSGKSTFLNAVLGAEVLGSAVREFTAVVTFLRQTPKLGYTASLVSGETETFDESYPYPDPEYDAQHTVLVARIADCAAKRSAFPAEVDELDVHIPEMEAVLAQMEADGAAKENAERDARGLYAQAHRATEAFAAELKACERQVPFCYREIGNWASPWNWTGRLVTKQFAKPEWKAHFARVTQLDIDQAKARALHEKHVTAIAATEAVRGSIMRQKALIRSKQERLAFVQQYLAAAPALAEALDAEMLQITDAHNALHARRHEEFCRQVAILTDMRQRGSEVSELRIDYPSPLLPVDVIIIDTPGVNTASELNRERAWKVIIEEADACVVVSDIQQAVSESTCEFVDKVRETVPHIMLVMTKLDRALDNADLDGDKADTQVAEAIQAGESRFAAALDLSAEHVLSFAVAAKPALKQESPEAVERFKVEMERLFTAITAERSIAVGSRCAKALQRIHSETSGLVEKTEAAARQRLDLLMAQNITNPAEFCRNQLHAVRDRLDAAAAEASNIMKLAGLAPLQAFGNTAIDLVQACKKPKELEAAANEIERRSKVTIDQVAEACCGSVDAAMGGTLQQLIADLRTDLRRRYQIGQSVSNATPHEMPLRPLSAASSKQLTDIGRLLQSKVSDFIATQRSIGYGGASVGRSFATGHPAVALVGLVIVGIRAATAPSFSSVCTKCAGEIKAIVDSVIASSEADASPDAIAGRFHAGLEAILLADIEEFRRWIEDVIAKERMEMERTTTALADLSDIRKRLAAHDASLTSLLSSAQRNSRGLSHSAPLATESI